MDRIELLELLEDIFDDYERRRVDELFGAAKGSGRVSTSELQYVAGKGQASREIKNHIYTRLGFSD